MKTIVSSLLLFFFLVSCTSTIQTETNTKHLHTIDIYPEKYSNFLISDIFSSYDLIMFPESEFGPISDFDRAIEFGNKLVLLDKEDRVIFLDDNNHLESIFKNKGNGPGEYIELGDINISIDGNHLYALDHQKGQLLEYSVEGKNLNQFIDGRMIASSSFSPLGDDLFAFYGGTLYYGGLNKRLLIIKKGDKTAYTWGDLTEKETNYNYIIEPTNFYFNNNEVFFHYPFNDTIYKITNDSLIPKFFINLGDSKLPEDILDRDFEDLIEFVEYLENSGKVFLLIHFVNIGNMCFFQFQRESNYYHCYYDLEKNEAKIVSAYQVEEKFGGINPQNTVFIGSSSTALYFKLDGYTINNWLDSTKISESEIMTKKSKELIDKFKKMKPIGNPTILKVTL